MVETIQTTKILTKEGFKVMVYCTDDPLLAKKLEDNGASAIMPLASPIGSGLGIRNKVNISLIIKQSKVPVIIDDITRVENLHFFMGIDMLSGRDHDPALRA